MGKLYKIYKGIEESAVKAYKATEKAAVKGYKMVENTAVKAYNGVEDMFIEKIFAKDGETVEETKARLRGDDVETPADENAEAAYETVESEQGGEENAEIIKEEIKESEETGRESNEA